MVVSSLRFYPPPPPPPPPLSRPPEQRDVLIFQSFLLQKRAAPSSILEGSQAVYSVKLNGPPPTHVAIELNASDQLTRFVCLHCVRKTVLSNISLPFLSLLFILYIYTIRAPLHTPHTLTVPLPLSFPHISSFSNLYELISTFH